mgnify:CR=1 FL=1
MKYGYCFLGVVPVRKEPKSTSEQVTQLLFGDFVETIETCDGWTKIRNTADGYEGFVDSRNLLPIARKRKNNYFTTNMFSYIQMDRELIPVPFGVKLIGKDFTIGEHHFQVPHTNFSKTLDFTKENIREIVLPFLNVPYLWGGKSSMGIDCSGFTQIVYSCFGIDLPRDASEQVKMGKEIPSVFAAKEGDLCFFSNEDGRISHVGIFLEKQYIIHASGRVRIDLIDNNGITDHSTREYTHWLQHIRRIFD